MTNFSRDSYSPVSDNSIVFMPSPSPISSFNNNINNNLSDKNISNNNNSNYVCDHNNESTKQKELPIIREETSSKSDKNTSKQPKKTKKSKVKSDVQDKKYLSLPSTPHQAALISALNPALTQLAKSASTATTPTKPTIERFKNKSKILDSNLRKFINYNSSSTSIKEGHRETLEAFDVLNEVEIKNKKYKRKNKKDGKLINKERKVRILWFFFSQKRIIVSKLPD
jgi:hypothetical protein